MEEEEEEEKKRDDWIIELAILAEVGYRLRLLGGSARSLLLLLLHITPALSPKP